jgi:hypothetical protein
LIFGTNIYDYGDQKQAFYENFKPMMQMWQMTQGMMIPGLRQDKIVDHPINKFGAIACMQ